MVKWNVQGVSVQGKSHKDRDIVCQDANGKRREVIDDGQQWIFVSVADGAGSAARSDEGAEEAVEASLKAVTSDMSHHAFLNDAETPLEDLKGLLISSMEKAISSVKDLAKDEEAVPSDFSTTLLLLAAGPSHAAAAQVGDGAVVYESTEGEYSLMTTPQNGEYRNQTVFITSDDAQSAIDVECVCDTPGRFALFTDGIEQVALDMSEMSPHTPFFEPLFQFSAQEDVSDEKLEDQLKDFLESSRFSQHTEDDLTLLLASRLEQSAADDS